MAVVTFTRRQVIDMLPEFLTKRLATFYPIADALAKENGISRNALTTLNGMLTIREGDLVRRARLAWRSPYAVKRPALEQGWAEIVAAGLAGSSADGWRVRPRAIELANETSRRIRAHVRGLVLPQAEARRVAADLVRLADRIPPTAERAALIRRVRPSVDEPTSDAVAASLAANELWAFRDDCHIGTWQAAGYEGPAFEVLSFVWSSPGDVSWTKLPAVDSIDRLAKALEARQDRLDVEGNVAGLVKRGDLAREDGRVRITAQGQRARDAIEEETDRRYFAVWDLDDAATARLGDDMRSIIDALPKG